MTSTKYIVTQNSVLSHGTNCPLGAEVYMNELLELHREDGPAVIYPNEPRRQEWWQHGFLHRVDDPAVDYPNSIKMKKWFVEGREINYLPSDEDKWLLLKANPENIEAFPEICNRKMQKFVINRRPDLITKILKLDSVLKET